MPFYNCALRSLAPQPGALVSAVGDEPHLDPWKLLSRLVRELSCQWILDNILPLKTNILELKQQDSKRKIYIESAKLMPHLRMGYAAILDMLAMSELASENPDHLVMIDAALDMLWTCVEVIDNDQDKIHATQLNNWVTDIYQLLRDFTKSTSVIRVCSPSAWFLWGQSLVKISRNYLITTHGTAPNYIKHMYTFCLTMAATKFQKCQRLLSQTERTSHSNKEALEVIRKALAECHAGFGYTILSISRDVVDPLARKLRLVEAYGALKTSATMMPIPNAIYNIACVTSLQESKVQCKQWLEFAASRQLLPPQVNIYNDPDLDPIRDLPWFGEFLQKVPSEKPPTDRSWLFSTHLSLSLMSSSYGMPGTINIPSIVPDIPSQAISNNNSQPSAVTNSLSDSIRFDEEMNKLQASLQREGFTRSAIRQTVIEVYSAKKAEQKQKQNFEAAHARLEVRMATAGFRPKSVIPADGNCQYHSLADQLFDSIEHSAWVRKSIVDWLRKNGDFVLPGNGAMLRDFAMEDWDQYCNTMSKNGIWGDHLTLTAATQLFGVRIVILSSIEDDNYVTEYLPTVITSPKVLYLCHYAEYHYGSLERIPETELSNIPAESPEIELKTATNGA